MFLVPSVKSGPATEIGTSVSSDITANEHVASKPTPLTSSGATPDFSRTRRLQKQIADQMSSVDCSCVDGLLALMKLQLRRLLQPQQWPLGEGDVSPAVSGHSHSNSLSDSRSLCLSIRRP